MSDGGGTPSDNQIDAQGDGRRSFIKKAAIGVGAAWVAPTILHASPAWAGTPPGSLIPPGESDITFATTTPAGAAWDFDPTNTDLDCASGSSFSSNTDVAVVGEGAWFIDGGTPLSANIGLADAGTGPQCANDLARSVSGQVASYYIFAKKASGGSFTWEGSMTFPAGWEILGVFWNTTAGSGPLTDSAGLESASYTYGTYDRLLCANDRVELSADARTVSVRFRMESGCDAVRVVIGES